MQDLEQRPIYFISPSWRGGFIVKCKEASFGTGTFPEMTKEGAEEYALFLSHLVFCEVRLLDLNLSVISACKPNKNFHDSLLDWLSCLSQFPAATQLKFIEAAAAIRCNCAGAIWHGVAANPRVGEGEVVISGP